MAHADAAWHAVNFDRELPAAARSGSRRHRHLASPIAWKKKRPTEDVVGRKLRSITLRGGAGTTRAAPRIQSDGAGPRIVVRPVPIRS